MLLISDIALLLVVGVFVLNLFRLSGNKPSLFKNAAVLWVLLFLSTLSITLRVTCIMSQL